MGAALLLNRLPGATLAMVGTSLCPLVLKGHEEENADKTPASSLLQREQEYQKRSPDVQKLLSLQGDAVAKRRFEMGICCDSSLIQ